MTEERKAMMRIYRHRSYIKHREERLLKRHEAYIKSRPEQVRKYHSKYLNNKQSE